MVYFFSGMNERVSCAMISYRGSRDGQLTCASQQEFPHLASIDSGSGISRIASHRLMTYIYIAQNN